MGDRAARRARARQRLLHGVGSDATPPRPSTVDPVVRATEANFSDFCEATLALGCHSQEAVDSWNAELTALRTDSERHAHRLALLERLFRGCRVRLARYTEMLNGCEGVVLPSKAATGVERRLPVRATLPDGVIEELSLRPDQLRLVAGRKQAEEEEAEQTALADAQEAEAYARRLSQATPHVLHRELNAELKSKSMTELRLMAERIHEGEELLVNPLLSYDKATFREALAELMMKSAAAARSNCTGLARAQLCDALLDSSPCVCSSRWLAGRTTAVPS
jgi:hypothetical protein